jgi:signal transduction histidine kinase
MALELRTLMRSRAQLATLAERQRLARDLHDTVKQKAFALNMQLATARRVIGAVPGSERLEQAQKLTQQIQRELGELLDEMRSSDADLPLVERVRSRANDWSHTSSMPVALRLDDVPPLPVPTEDAGETPPFSVVVGPGAFGAGARSRIGRGTCRGRSGE